MTAGFDAPAGAAVVIDAPTYEVTTDVVESDLADVEVGQTAAVRVDAIDAELTGTVTAISPVDGERQRLGRRVLSRHRHPRRGAGRPAQRDVRRRDDHHRQRDRRPDRAQRRAARRRRRLPRA